MTAITIRKLPEGTKQKLRLRAAANGRSMEAEARDILVSALDAPARVDLSWVQLLIEAGLEHGDEGLKLPSRASGRPVDLFQ
ncbi:FitA-like ribbon-helix-helix domain-containing protein [Propioniciclava tarda]|uniref:Arc family DNA-binding protein n=1 Tax=Propioniciclava tarda TaxID=433330 RepID=A0A4Q9KNU0_PROTD|nr:Arc family DNA-binding protein [Propioniciclava tarda]TBT96276.1 Arc family DNA-binding protein [Propioniciclava tarda]SMO34676.1 Arc-like DNA binding domain-containing protein [Propioniciclava tarda]HOA88893.1 Arc family DNA-binding protein [Propioniciclava tarda]HQA31602.1 Arc family DNA-binding protein [Propioniciclava tarda]HQD61249.1 Arc family DNA-binding protein [Propioniciclava tarda]